MQYVAEPLKPSEEVERILSKLPSVVILNSQTGLEAVLANLLTEASMVDVCMAPLHGPLDDAIRGLFFAGDPGADLSTVQHSFYETIERALTSQLIVAISIDRIREGLNDWPTTVVYDVRNDEECAAVYKAFGADCLIMHLVDVGKPLNGESLVPLSASVYDGITTNQLLEAFIASLPQKP